MSIAVDPTNPMPPAASEAGYGPAPWPYRRNVVFLVNPAERRPLAAMLAAIVLLSVLAFPHDSPLQRWARAEQRRIDIAKIASTIEPLAQQGKPDAVIWVAINEPDKDGGRLMQVAQAGNAQAMGLVAEKLWATDRAASHSWMERSASAGYAPAVAWLSRHPSIVPTAAHAG
jgi:hypothetical protein